MGRKSKSFERLSKLYRYKDAVFKSTRIPVLRNIGRRMVDVDSLSITYIPVNEDLELPQGTAAPGSLAEHFINEASYHVILHRCPCRSENDCQEFDPGFGCTFMGEGAREIDPSVGRHVSREEALQHYHEAVELGLVTCLGKFKGDALALGVRKYDRLMTMCHCCPCCCISNSAHYGSEEARSLIVKLEGVTVEVTDDCTGCSKCVDACIFRQINMEDGRAVIGDECKGCGRCATVCPQDAIRITVDNPAYVEESIARINSLVDVT